MKLARILSKFFAKTCQEDLRRAEISLQYHKGMVKVFEGRIAEGRIELEHIEGMKK